MKITINIEKEHYPIEYEIDAYWQRSKTEYSEDEERKWKKIWIKRKGWELYLSLF